MRTANACMVLFSSARVGGGNGGVGVRRRVAKRDERCELGVDGRGRSDAGRTLVEGERIGARASACGVGRLLRVSAGARVRTRWDGG